MPPVSIARIPFILDRHLEASFLGAIIAFPGEKFEPAEQTSLWLRPTFITDGRMLDGEKGRDGYSRRDGAYLVDIFTPAKTGARADCLDMAEQVEAAFRRRCLSGLMLGDPYTEDKGIDPYDNYFVRVTALWWCWAA